MKRTLTLTIGVTATVIVLAQIGLGLYLALTGVLTAETLWELQPILEGAEPKSENPQAMTAFEPEFSVEELMQERAMRIFDLEDREQELERLSQLVIARRDAVLTEQKDLVTRRERYAAELQKAKNLEESEATTLAQGVLLSVPPADAARELMQLPLEQNVLILRGMPVKSIGKILKEFHQGDDQLRKRGVEIFEALADGDPNVRLIEEEIQNIP